MQEQGHPLVALSRAGLEPQLWITAALVWMLRANADREWWPDTTTLQDGLARLATGTSKGRRGFGFENAIIDALTDPDIYLPSLRDGIAAGISTLVPARAVGADFHRPRIIGVFLDRSIERSWLRTSLKDVHAALHPDAVLVTAQPGANTKLAIRNRMQLLVGASARGQLPSAFGPTTRDVNHADLMIGDADGRWWIAVDVKSGDARPATNNRGIHVGIWGVERLQGDSDVRLLVNNRWYSLIRGRERPPGTRPSFVLIELGLHGTPFDELRTVDELAPQLARIAPSTDIRKVPPPLRVTAGFIQPLLRLPLHRALDQLDPRGQKTLIVPTVGAPPPLTGTVDMSAA